MATQYLTQEHCPCHSNPDLVDDIAKNCTVNMLATTIKRSMNLTSYNMYERQGCLDSYDEEHEVSSWLLMTCKAVKKPVIHRSLKSEPYKAFPDIFSEGNEGLGFVIKETRLLIKMNAMIFTVMKNISMSYRILLHRQTTEE